MAANASPRALAVVAHPDDELLGCAGTLARLAKDGATVHILIMATGATSRGTAAGAREIAALQQQAQEAAQIIGAQPPQFGGLPDNRMDGVVLLDVVKMIETHAAGIEPTIVFTHHGGDLNVDHRLTHDAVMTAFRPLPGAKCRAIYGFETLSSTEWNATDAHPAFRPSRFVDISDTLATKLQALGRYADEMRPFPHARSLEAVEALARYRGASAGLAAAEAFTVLREVV